MKISERWLPLLVLCCALLWGSAFPGIKGIYAEWQTIGVENNFFNRLFIAGVRFMLAGAVLLLLAKQPIKDLGNSNKLELLKFSLTQTYIQYILFYSALAVSSGVLGGLLASTGTFWWLLLAPLMLKTPWPNKKQWGLFLVGAIGVSIAVYKPGEGSSNIWLGVPLFLASTFSGALAVILLQKVLKNMGARAATGYGLFIGGTLHVLTAIPAWPTALSLFTPNVIYLTLYLAGVSALAFSLWNHLTKLFPVNLLAGYRFIIPVCAVIESSFFVTGESPGIGIWIGGAIVISSVIALQWLKRQQEKETKKSKNLST